MTSFCRLQRARYFLVLPIALILTACGGESGDSHAPSASQLQAQESNAPALTGDVATDGLNWFNFRRQQAGLPALKRNSTLDRAARAHASYQQVNNVVTHDENAAQPGYTGAESQQRLRAAGFQFNPYGYSDGEVIAATAGRDGFSAAEGLMAAIYHRFVILQPVFDEAGAGTATRDGGYTWLNLNFVFNQPRSTQTGRLIHWPGSQQKNVSVNFFSDQETPDPVAQRDEVGFPVSVHADINAFITVDSFTIRPAGAAPLPARLLVTASDPETPHSAAAIIPLMPLLGATGYEVEFVGAVDGVAVNRRWTFSTR